jgi:ParB family transcriptional regulator, chromosome partitioning protein
MPDECAPAVAGSPVELLDPSVIKIGPRWRQMIDREGLEYLKESISRIGVKIPISVRRMDNEWHLVAGLHRLTGCLELGITSIPVREETGDDTDALMWEISENLHRIELTPLEHDKHVAKWIELCEQRGSVQKAQNAPIESKRDDGRGHRQEGGINAASRELGIERTDAQRAVKVASLSDEAQHEAVKLGLDDNRSALLKAAEQPDAQSQVQALRDHNVSKVTKAAKKLSKEEWRVFWDWAVSDNERRGGV